MGLAAALFLCPVTPALAAEIPEESVPAEVVETPLPEETEAAVPEDTAPLEEEPAPAETTLPWAEETTPPTETTLPEETTAPTETTEPVIPQDTEPPETLPATEPTRPAQPPAPTVLTISQALDTPPDTRDITIRGTVVYSLGIQAVLQDDTGGIRLSFPEDPGITPGQILQVTGRRSAGLFVSDFELLGTGDLPAAETTLLNAPENLRVRIRGAEASGGYLRQQGLSLSLAGDLPQTWDSKVDAFGVILDGRFYADTILPAATASPASQTASTPSPMAGTAETEPVYHPYFGLLHAHTDISDGEGSVEEAFQYASEIPQLDFFAITDHSHSFENASKGSLSADGNAVSADWARGKAAAKAVTDGDFVGIFGFEISWPFDTRLGHISTFNTPGWQTWQQKDSNNLVGYYDLLAKNDSYIGQFNHPDYNIGKFQRFDHCTAAYDQVMHLIEVGSEGQTYYDAYSEALDKGWHLAPTNNQNNHDGRWGDDSPVRTVILAEELTEQSLYDAIRHYRVYATEDSDLKIEYRMNGAMMGTILGPTEERTITVTLEDATDGTEGTTVEVISDGGTVSVKEVPCGPDGMVVISAPSDYTYYYLRITQPDGDIAVTAPVWIETYEDLGIKTFSADNNYPQAGEEVELSMEWYNEEWKDFSIEKMELLKDGAVLETRGAGTVLKAASQDTQLFSYTRPDAGESVLTVRITGTIEGHLRVYEKSLTLHFQPSDPQAVSIASARSGVPGQAYHVKGYVTAGTSNPYNTFDDTLYLQDDTGGIAVTGALPAGVYVGKPLSVIGVLRRQAGNLVLDATKTIPLEDTGDFRFEPRTMSNSAATDYASNGGKLIQVEGTLVSLTKDGKSVSRFTLRDLRGDLVTVVIDDNIRSGTYGTNELAGILKKGRTIRAIGLLHVDEFQQSVLRVRNCDEVVYIAPRIIPRADPTNPKTGDWLWFLA